MEGTDSTIHGIACQETRYICYPPFLFTPAKSCTMLTLPSRSSNQPCDKRLRKSNFRCRGVRCGKKKMRSLKESPATPQLLQTLRLHRAQLPPVRPQSPVLSPLRRARLHALVRELELKGKSREAKIYLLT